MRVVQVFHHVSVALVELYVVAQRRGIVLRLVIGSFHPQSIIKYIYIQVVPVEMMRLQQDIEHTKEYYLLYSFFR